jgi:hypothetical protein
MKPPTLSIEERVREALEVLALLGAVGCAHVDEIADLDATFAGISRVAERAHRVLKPVMDAPGDVLNWTPGDRVHR